MKQSGKKTPVVLAIVALEAFLFLLLMARRGDRRMTAVALALPPVIIAAAILAEFGIEEFPVARDH